MAWELLHLPFYTIWSESPLRESVAAAVHCTFGDAVIATWTLLVPILIFGQTWPKENFFAVAFATIVLALGYTTFSEWWNVEVRQTWAYSPLMPRLPYTGTGLSPLLQWIVVPAASFAILTLLPPTNRQPV